VWVKLRNFAEKNREIKRFQIMSSKEIFASALNLPTPWYIKEVRLESLRSQQQELHIHLDFERGYRFTTRTGEQRTAYDSLERTWQHLNFFQHRCYIHARVPRLEDAQGKVYQIEVPWARTDSGFTLMFEAYAMLLIENEMPVCKAASTIGVTAPRLWRVFTHWVRKSLAQMDLSNVKRIGVDETSSKRGHSYITNVVDLDTKKTIFVTPGKDAKTIERFAEHLENNGGARNDISLVSMDMSPAFFCGVGQNLPKAQIIYDKFHLVKLLNEALDSVLRLERKENALLKHHRYTILRRYENLKPDKKEALDMLLPLYPKLGEAYRLRQLFLDAFEISDAEQAKGYLSFWIEQVLEAGIEPFKKFVNTLKAHWWGVVAYFDSRVTNGILEGINSKIQLAKRRARGYRNINNFIYMTYFISANLKPAYYPYKTL
jgi:transposase